MNFVHKWPASGEDASPEEPGEGAERPDSGKRFAEVSAWLIAGLILASLWWTTLCLGGFRPETMPVNVALNAAAVLIWLAREWRQHRGLQLSLPILATVPFLVYAAVNAGWLTPVPWLGWRDWLNWMQMAAVFATVSQGVRGPRAREALFWGIALLGVVAVAMAGYQRLGDPGWLMMGRRQAAQFLDRSSGPFGIPNSLAAFLNLLLPPLLALTLRRGAGAMPRVLGGYLAVLFACGLLLTLSRGAWLALGAAVAAWPLLVVRDRDRRWLGTLAVTALLAAVAGAVYVRDSKAHERVDALLQHPIEPSRAVMWRAGWRLFLENPLVGSGAGSYGVVFERHRPERFWDAPQWAHNDCLNTLSDYGAIGFLLSFGVLAVAGWSWMSGLRYNANAPDSGGGAADGRQRALQVGIAIGLLAFALQLFVDFNLKIPALAQTAAALAGLTISTGGSDRPAFFRRSWRAGPIVLLGAALVVAIAVPGWIVPIYRAEALRYAARQELDDLAVHPPTQGETARRLRDARDRLSRATRGDPHNAQAWSDLADALIEESRVAPARTIELGGEAEAAATRALGLSPAVAEFWLHRGLALDLQGRWRDAWADFVRALALAPRRADLWYYYAYHLSLRDLESAKSALATCLRLDPWNQPALAFQKQLGGRSH